MGSSRWAATMTDVCLVTAVAIAYAAGKSPAPVQEIVRAKQFQLVDQAGTVRALLATSKRGDPRLVLSNREGMARALLGVEPDGTPEVVLLDRGGSQRVLLGVDHPVEGSPQEVPELLFSDEGHRQRAELSLGLDGAPRLVLSDHSGAKRAVLGASRADAAPGGAMEASEFSLVLSDKDHKVLWRVP